MMLSMEKFCEVRAEWTWVYMARYSNVKCNHIRCKKEKNSKTETCLGPLLINGSVSPTGRTMTRMSCNNLTLVSYTLYTQLLCTGSIRWVRIQERKI